MNLHLEIKIPTLVGERAYIQFYLNGKRVRVYSGRTMLLNIEPNRAKDPSKRLELLYKLREELYKHLLNGNYPMIKAANVPVKIEPKELSTLECLNRAIAMKENMKLNPQYKKDLRQIMGVFTSFLSKQELDNPLRSVTLSRLEEFLSRYNSSGSYYMKKRSDFSILFSQAAKLSGIPSIARDTHTERSKAKLHITYTKEELRTLLSYLSLNSPQMYLCCLFTYGCWLRPHIEVLSLTKHHFKNEYTEIHLDGNENKGGKVRVVYVPDYVLNEIRETLNSLKDDMNIFTRESQVLNNYYFTTMWKRLRPTLLKRGLIKDGQTIYSFRHTAAVNVYRKQKDIYMLQRLLGHGSIGVTQKYLRGLGEVNIQEMRDAAPQL
jgi:integrase